MRRRKTKRRALFCRAYSETDCREGQSSMTNPIDLTRRIFGHLTAVQFLDTTGGQGARWRCQCVCGRTVIKTAKELLRRGGMTVAGYPMSCGCHQADQLRITAPAGNVVHGTPEERPS
jgi:hypothetical protein